MNTAPAREMIPRIKLELEHLERMKTVVAIIGISVTTGAAETIIPSFLLCMIVSVMTRASRGPGEIPAANPKRIPETRY